MGSTPGLMGEDKTWTGGPWTPLFGPDPWTTFMDPVRGPPVMDQVHGQFFLNFYKKVLVHGHSKQK